MKTADELLREYQILRGIQKAYFKTRRHEDLDTAKNLERALDKDVKEYFEEQDWKKYGRQTGMEL